MTKRNRIKLLLFIDNLGPGGKQRRLLELIKNLSPRKDFDLYLLLTSRDIVYEEVHLLNITIDYAVRKSKKDAALFFQIGPFHQH